MLSVMPGTAVVLRPTLIATVVEDGAVLLDLETKYFYSLNKTAWTIVQFFELSPASQDEIETRCRELGAAPGEGLQFLAELEREGLLEFSEDAERVQPPAYAGPWEPPLMTRQAEPLQNVVASAFDPSIPLAE